MEKSKEELLSDGMRIENFKNDPIVSGAIGKLERKYYEEFKSSKTSEDRVRSWAKAQVLDDFLNELNVVVGAGQRASIELTAKKRPASR
jgi:hypothetical protein